MSAICSSSSAPSKPAYFEFLLRPSLLEEHIKHPDADPSPVDLITQMIYNGLQKNSAESVGSHTDVELVQRKAHMLVVLPLRMLVHLNYDVQLVLDKLPLEICDALLSYLLGECLGPIATEINLPTSTLDIASLLPHQIFATSIYLRYVLSAVVASRMPRPLQQRTTPLNVPGLNSEGSLEFREEREVLLAELNNKADFAARRLEAILHATTQVTSPLTSSFSLSCPAPGAPKGSSHNFSNSAHVPLSHFQCQVHYDIGLYYFVTERYNEALHHFTQSSVLYSNIQEKSPHCCVNGDLLKAYTSSCSAVCGHNAPLQTMSLLQKFGHTSSLPSRQGILEVLSEDDLAHQVPYYLRHRLQIDLMTEPPHATTQGLFFQVCCHNVVRCVLEGRIWDSTFASHLVTAGKQGALYLLQLLSCKVPKLSERERRSVHQLLVSLNIQEGVSNVLVPPLMNTPALASLFTHQQILDMWQGVEEENQAKLMRQALDVNYGVSVEVVNETSLVWELIHSYDPVSLCRAVKRYVANLLQQQQVHGTFKDILDLNDKWDVPIPIRNTLLKLPSLLHRFLVAIFVAKGEELILSKRWNECSDLMDASLKACREAAEGGGEDRGESGRLYKMLTWLKLSHNIQKWIHGLPAVDEGGAALASEAKLCLMALNGREDAVPWTNIINWCVICLVNARDWGGVLGIVSGLQIPPTHLPLLSFLRLLLSAAHLLDSPPPPHHHPEPQFNQLWDAVSAIMNNASSSSRCNGSGKDRHAENGFLLLTGFLELVQCLKDATCLSLLTSLLGVLYNKLLGEPSAEIHTQHASVWAPMTPNKDIDLPLVRETLTTVVHHAIKFFPGADHVNEVSATSWQMTAADLHYTSEEYQEALCGYLTAVFVATNFLRSDPTDEATAHLVGDRAVRRMVRCCMNIGCYTQAGLLCQFLEPIDYSTALRCLQDRSGVDAMDAYYNCLWDVTLIEFIINMHHKKGEIQRRDAVLKVIGQLEINSNNNEEIQREAAKVRKHRLLRALAKQYLN